MPEQTSMKREKLGVVAHDNDGQPTGLSSPGATKAIPLGSYSV